MHDIEHVLAVRNKLGEGPVWRADEQALYWVDIERNCVYRFYPRSGRYDNFHVGEMIGVRAIRAAGPLVLASRNGFGFCGQSFRYLTLPASQQPTTLLSDAAL